MIQKKIIYIINESVVEKESLNWIQSCSIHSYKTFKNISSSWLTVRITYSVVCRDCLHYENVCTGCYFSSCKNQLWCIIRVSDDISSTRFVPVPLCSLYIVTLHFPFLNQQTIIICYIYVYIYTLHTYCTFLDFTT